MGLPTAAAAERRGRRCAEIQARGGSATGPRQQVFPRACVRSLSRDLDQHSCCGAYTTLMQSNSARSSRPFAHVLAAINRSVDNVLAVPCGREANGHGPEGQRCSDIQCGTAAACRLLQRKCASDVLGVDFSSVDIRRTKGGKPFVVADDHRPHAPNFNFNISHEVCKTCHPGPKQVCPSKHDSYRCISRMAFLLMRATLPEYPGCHTSAMIKWHHNPHTSDIVDVGASAQGHYVVLASEGHCLCGIDVAAPRHLRRSPQQPVATYLQSFRKQFTEREVAARASLPAPAPCLAKHTVALCFLW